MNIPFRASLAVALLAIIGASASPALANDRAIPPSPPPDVQVAQLEADVAAGAAYVGEVQADEIVAYVAATEAAEAQARFDAEAAAIQAEVAAVEHERDASRVAPQRSSVTPAPTTQPAPAPTTGSTGACGGATNGADQYIQRESGGNPSVANPSGAYGCYQIMPSTWASSCRDLGPEIGSSADTQAKCASRLPMSAWAL